MSDKKAGSTIREMLVEPVGPSEYAAGWNAGVTETLGAIRQAVEEVRAEYASTDDNPNELCDCPDCESVQMALDALLARFGEAP